MKILHATAVAIGALLLAPVGPASADAVPTCFDTLGISNHGQHIVGDYVTSLGSRAMGWAPNSQIGSTVSRNGGAAVPGGPGPGCHFPNVVAPGASNTIITRQIVENQVRYKPRAPEPGGSNSPSAHF